MESTVAYEPRRTLLVGLSALAVVFAAALLPAAGLGTHPGSPGVAVPDDSTSESTPTPEPADPTPTEVRDEPSDTATPSPADTEAPSAPGDDEGRDAGTSLWGLLGGAAKLFVVGVGAVLLLALVALLQGVEPGSPDVGLPFGITVSLPFTVPAWAGTIGTRVSRLTMGFVLAVSASTGQLLDATGTALGGVVSGLGIAAGEGLRGTTRLLAAVPAGIVGSLASLAALPALLSTSPDVPAIGSVLPSRGDRPETDAREMGPAQPVDDEPGETGPPTVREAWVTMTDLLPVERDAATTPAEFARAAVERGFPAGPVGRLTRAFEDVVYGGQDPEERTSTARDALGRLRDRLGGET